MAKVKVEDNMIWVLLAAIRMYSANFLKFCYYMLFPVLGQILGIGLVFGLAALFINYLPDLIIKYDVLKDVSTIVLAVIIITIPGLLIFMKAFWDYLVAYGAINSIVDGFLSSGKIYDFPAHNETVTSRSFKFITLWLLCSIFMLLASFPLLWIVGAFAFIYFILVFQVFSFEPETGAVGCFKRSFQIIRGNSVRTLLIIIVLSVITILFIQGVSVIFDFIKLTGVLSTFFENSLVNYIPVDSINDFMLKFNPSFELITPEKIANMLVAQVVTFIVCGFTLPLRSICWALWYKGLTKNIQIQKTEKKTSKKKKLDPKIIDRATREYND